MMTNDDYQHFVCIVAGDNPEELIKKYKNGKVEPYVVYPFSSASKLHQQYIEAYRTFCESDELTEQEREMMRIELEMIEEDSDTEFFSRLTEKYEHDSETGDAISTDNPDGKYALAEKGHYMSVPFKLKDSIDETYQAEKKEIDWKEMHLGNARPYEVAWETVMEKRKPEDEYEENIYNNMCNLGCYLQKFGDKETYIASSTAFWGYAFLSEETGWVELEDNVSQLDWMMNYYPNFIEPLKDNTILTIYECKR